VLLFGPEPTGLPDEVLDHPRVPDRVRIPMVPGRRSLVVRTGAGEEGRHALGARIASAYLGLLDAAAEAG